MAYKPKKFPSLKFRGDKKNGKPVELHKAPDSKKRYKDWISPARPRPPLDLGDLSEKCSKFRTSVPHNTPRLDPAGATLELDETMHGELVSDINIATTLSITQIDEVVEACIAVQGFMLRKGIDSEPYLRTGIRIVKK